MTKLFLDIYDFFKTRRALLFGVSILLVSLMTFLATCVDFDENISDIFPKTKDGGDLSLVIDNLKNKDKIIVLFEKRCDTLSNDVLVDVCEDFAERLDDCGSEVRERIHSLTTQVGSEEISQTTEFIYDHLPIFIGDDEYRRIDSLLRDGGMDGIMERNYQRMLSPVGIGLGAYIARDPLSIAGGTLNELQNFNPSLSYQLYDDHIFSEDMSACMLIIEPTYPGSDTSRNEKLVEALDRLVSRAEYASEGVDVSYFGTPAIAVYNARQIKNDTYITLSLALLLVIGIITLSFRNRWSVLLITLPVCFGGLFALGVIALTTGHISLIAIGAGASVFGIAISYSIHVVCHANHTTHPRDIVGDLAYPMTVGSFTTIGAFVGLMFTSSSLLSDFGLFAALSLVGTTLFSLICLPHLLGGNQEKAPNRFLRVIERFNAYPFEKNKWLVTAILLLFLLGIFTCNRVNFDSEMSHLSYIPEQIASTERKLERLFDTDAQSVTVIASATNVEEAVKRYTQMCDFLDGQLQTRQIRSFVSARRFVVAPSEQQRKIERWNRFWKEENRRERLIQQVEAAGRKAGFATWAFAGFRELLSREYSVMDYAGDKLPATPLLNAWVNSSDKATLVLSQVCIDAKNKERLYGQLAQMEGVIAVDRGYFANKMARTVSDDFNYVLYMSGLLVFFALLMTYRRLELTLMTFAPMFIAFTVILGLMAVFGFEFNIVNIILSTFIFGIGDDFSIFIMDGLQREYTSGRKMLTNHKTAIFFSVLATIIGIGALSFANHPVLRSTSIISIIGMSAVILSAYTILPLLFRWLVIKPVARGGVPYTLSSLGRTLFCFLIFFVICSIGQGFLPILFLLPVSGRRKRRYLHYLTYYCCRGMLWMISATEHRKIINPDGQKFERPSLIIANHHSFVDILLLLSMSPRLVMVTNSWVWQSPLFGHIIRYMGFCCIDEGYEKMSEQLKKNLEEGYSIVIFPEGTRSTDGRTVGRFHKGAFYIAEELGLDILPILIYGTGMICSKRNPFSIRCGVYGAKILRPISIHDEAFGEGYRQRSKSISRYFKSEYEAWCREEDCMENPFFHQNLIMSYVYKTDKAEFNARRRLRKTHGFRELMDGIGRDARIVVLGAGQGELPLLLSLLSPRRKVWAFEQDHELVSTARHCVGENMKVEFIETNYHLKSLPEADYYIFTRRTDETVRQQLVHLCHGELRYE